MKAVNVIRALLLAHPPVAALLGPTSVIIGTVKQGVMPAIGITEISRNEQSTVARSGPAKMMRARIQVTVYASSYTMQKALLAAAGLGAGTHTGTVAGIAVRSVLPEGVGPDFSDDAAGIFEQSRDFIVTYVEAN